MSTIDQKQKWCGRNAGKSVTTYASLEAEADVIGAKRLLRTRYLEASLLQNRDDATLEGLNRVVLVAENEVGVVETFDLDVDHRRRSVRSQRVHLLLII